MTTTDIELSLAKYFGVRTHIMVPNVSWGAGFADEKDLIVVRPSGYVVECEIKRSFSDYKNDFKKRKWKRYPNLSPVIREFYYVFPESLWKKRMSDIKAMLQPFAGVMYVDEEWNDVSVAIKAKPNKLAKKMDNKQKLMIARLGMLRMWSLKKQLNSKS
jgi:hypothetical protein